MRGKTTRNGWGRYWILTVCVLEAACTPVRVHDDSSTIAKIEAREAQAQGIDVGKPKVYDDSLLQQMLTAAEARLASLQVLDQTSIAAKLGSVTGATQSISSFGLSVMGPSIPSVATTANGATNSLVTTNNSVVTTSATPSTVATNTSVNTAGAPATNVVTTNPQMAPPTATAPAPSTTMPSGLSVSSSDILNEQMQLTYEIANLRLLLEGSLNDRVIGTTKLIKPRVTLGIPITLMPSANYENAIAVVEVEVDKAGADDLSKDQEPPAVVALLPREKTYNVASITDHSGSIGAGIVTHAVGISGSFLWGTKTYYTVQDEDTLALTFQPEDAQRAGFLWQFRPVLGAKYVRSGLKQVFVQLAFPTSASNQQFGSVHVKTYWREYNHKKNLVKSIIPGSLREYEKPWPITNYPLDQAPLVFNADSLEDLGNGQMLVTLQGKFLGGTYVRIGPNLLRDGSPAFSLQYSQIQFASAIADLATKRIALVARDGTETPLELDKKIFGSSHPLIARKHSITTVDDSNLKLSVELAPIDEQQNAPPIIFVIGGRVFGYSDAPLTREPGKNVWSAVVPTALLRAYPSVQVKRLFTNQDHWAQGLVAVTELILAPVSPKVALLSQGESSSSFLLFGDHLDRYALTSPKVTLNSYGSLPGHSVGEFELDKAQLKTVKAITLEGRDGMLLQVPLPAPSADDSSSSKLIPPAPVLVGTDEVVLGGEGLDGVQKVLFKGVELKLQKQSDGKALWVSGLKASGVTASAGTQPLEVDFKASKQMLSLLVVAPKS